MSIEERHPVVGVWLVSAPDAPFPHHVFTFHADGTLLQANPPAGNAGSSDSVGMGVWEADGWAVRGRFAEQTADRETRAWTGTRVVDFTIHVNEGPAFTGAAYTAGGAVTPLTGRRLILDRQRPGSRSCH